MVMVVVVVMMAVGSRSAVSRQKRATFMLVFVFNSNLDGKPSGQRHGRVTLELGRVRRWSCKR